MAGWLNTGASAVQCLTRRRKAHARVALPLNQEWFTIREAAHLLGGKPLSVGTTVRRNRLEAEGKVKKAIGRNPLNAQEVAADCDSSRRMVFRAGDGARTHDSHVGNVALYH